MARIGNVRILFIAGFGPIVRDTAESRKLYSEVLGISFKEETGEYLHTEALKGAKTSPCGLFPRRRSLALAKIPGPTTFQLRKPGLSLMLTASNRRRRSLNHKDTECSSRTRKNRGDRLSVVSFHRKDCWLGLLLLYRCQREIAPPVHKELMEGRQRKQGHELAILNLGFPHQPKLHCDQ
jgi:hypothetical protein